MEVCWQGYEQILVICSQMTSWPNHDVSVTANTESAGFVLHGAWGSENKVMHRLGTYNDEGVRFADACYNGTGNNDACIPRFIYGVKGVRE